MDTHVGQDDLQDFEWDERHFKYHVFSTFSIDGNTICSDFVDCTFDKVDWYWGLFTQTNFIHCVFTDCVFRGTAFYDSRFVDCTFIRCQFIKDNLGGDCKFEGAVAYGCHLDETVGFMLNRQSINDRKAFDAGNTLH